MVYTFNLPSGPVSLAFQMLIGLVVLMIEGLLVAFVFFLVLTLSHRFHTNRKLLQGQAPNQNI